MKPVMPRRPAFVAPLVVLAMFAVFASAALLRSQAVPAQRRGTIEVQVEAHDRSYVPGAFTVPVSTSIEVTLVHSGTLSESHDIIFVLDGIRRAASAPVARGGRAMITFESPSETGTYVYYCSVGNHRQLGMEGTLHVVAMATALPARPSPRHRSYLPVGQSGGATATMAATPPTPTALPTYAPRLPPRSGCDRPIMICPPGAGTSTPFPDEGTPTICPTCRRR